MRIAEADEVFTPDIVLAELAAKFARKGIDFTTIRTWLQAVSETTRILAIDINIAEQSAKASIELIAQAKLNRLQKPGLADAIVLAAARTTGGKVLTGDQHFRDLPETTWLGR